MDEVAEAAARAAEVALVRRQGETEEQVPQVLTVLTVN